MEFDLDAVHAAKAEVTEAKTLSYRGRTWTLAAELPYNFLHLSDDEALVVLFGAEAAAEFAALDPTPSREDLGDLLLGILPMYGFVSPGESSASNGSSSNGSRPSRRISSRSTA